MSVDPEELRVAMRQWSTGVTVVTTAWDGIRHGMTVNSFTSISLEPPLVMVSLERSTRTHQLVEKSRIYGVTILSLSQRDISDCFAGRVSDKEDRFDGVLTFTMETGAPLITGGLAFFDCRVTSQMEAGTHTVYVAEVVAVRNGEGNSSDKNPLLYYNRNYRELQK